MKKVVITMGIIILFLSLALYAKKSLNVNLSQITNPGPIIENLTQTPVPATTSDNLQINVYASGLPNARVIAFDPSGTPLVSLTASGRVVALPDENKDLKADRMVEVLKSLRQPHGLAFSGNQLFVAETHQVISYTYNPQDFSVSDKQVLFSLPAGGGHFTRTLLIQGEKLYTAVGSSCNVCHESDDHRSTILQSNLDGSNLKIYASGLRNSVFQTIHPQTNQIWATEMGRDNLGDNLPPDEINVLVEGGDYGWPICYGNKVHDSQFDKNQYIQDPCNQTVASKIDLQAHSAPLGLAFVPSSWPQVYSNQLLVAYHGSWNRSTPTGYKIVSINPESGQITDLFTSQEYSQFISRPVDIKFNSQNQMFVTDDKLNHLLIISH